MTLVSALLGFAPLAAVLTILPGPDLTLVLRSAIVHGPRAALTTALGICTGGLVWGFAAAVGIAALMTAVPVAFTVLSYAGAAYLAYLGFHLLRAPVGETHVRKVAGRGAAAFAQGLTTNLLNPKVGVFYVSVIPQFPVPGVSPAIVGTALAGLHSAMSMVLFGAVAASAGRLGVLLSRPGVARGIDIVCGLFLFGFAAVIVARA